MDSIISDGEWDEQDTDALMSAIIVANPYAFGVDVEPLTLRAPASALAKPAPAPTDAVAFVRKNAPAIGMAAIGVVLVSALGFWAAKLLLAAAKGHALAAVAAAAPVACV